MSLENIKKEFYDLEQIKQIPILEVCGKFGVYVEEKGGKSWCKLRPERTASVVLHPESNTYHDFGTHEHSDSIGLVSAFCNVDRGEAIRLIADAFSISPVNPRGGLSSAELTTWEYEKIGLDGRMATRNFDFDLERQGQARVMELSFRYGMPMNVLKKNNPGIYQKLLWQRAIPHVKSLRVNYYTELYSYYNLMKEMGVADGFQKAAERGEFAEMIKELQSAERILERACKGTRIEAWPAGEYDPVTDLKNMLEGELKLSLGSVSKKDLEKLSEQEKSPKKYRSVDLGAFLTGAIDLKGFQYTTSIRKGTAVICFLEKDLKAISPILSKFSVSRKKDLDQKIAAAQNDRSAGLPSDPTRSTESVKAGAKREER